MVEQLIVLHTIDFIFEEGAGHAPMDAELLAKMQTGANRVFATLLLNHSAPSGGL